MLVTWTYASIRKFYKSILPEIPHYFNGEDAKHGDKEYIEINIFGPTVEYPDGKDAVVNVIVDVVIHVVKTANNVFRETVIADAFVRQVTDIPIYAFGPEGDESYKYCLTQAGPSAFTKVGNVTKDIELNRSVVRTGFTQVVEESIYDS